MSPLGQLAAEKVHRLLLAELELAAQGLRVHADVLARRGHQHGHAVQEGLHTQDAINRPENLFEGAQLSQYGEACVTFPSMPRRSAAGSPR